MSYYSIVSTELAIALVTLPRITAGDLYVRCKNLIGNVGVVQFKNDVSKWISDGTIPGYESRKGKVGGIYKKNAPNETVKVNQLVDEFKLDPEFIAEFIENILKTQNRITVGDLAKAIDYAPMTETQFKSQMSEWLNDGKTFPLFISRKGPMGGIYMRGVEMDKWAPSLTSNESDDSSEESFSEGSFTLQIAPTLRIVQSDDRNWTIQKKSGETWTNKFYHSNLRGVIDSAVKHILNGDFKLSNSTVVQLQDLSSMFKEMENRISIQLQKILEDKLK